MIRWLVSRILGFRGMTPGEARDWLALLYIPILTVCGVGVTLIISLGPWPDATAELRLTFLGWTLIGLLGLIGLGTFFLQRRTVDVKGTLPGGASFEIDNIPSPEIASRPAEIAS